MKIAAILRSDNSGLGSMSREFAENLRPHKIALVQNGVFNTFPERYSEFDCRTVRTNSDFREIRDWLLEDVDVVVAIETPYDWQVFSDAKRKGVKSALITMVEMQDRTLRFPPDLYICPSKLDYQEMPDEKVLMQWPVNTDKLIWKKREKAHTFVHSASHWGIDGRKGTNHVIEAMRYVKSDIKLKVYSWQQVEVDDPRIEIIVQNFKNYWQMWREGDVLIYPQNFNGICLPIVEAMSSGLGVITTDIFPFNEYMPKRLLFKPGATYKTRISPRTIEVDAVEIDPKEIAKKIDEIANKDISDVSLYGKEWAEKNSWNKLKKEWLKILG